jgi:two-component system cell cycle sensor histidine kinase/response regulator CckA
VVDDEQRIRAFYQRLLTNEGFSVLAAENADAANEIVKKSPVHLILLDLRRPVVEGHEFYDVLELFHRKVAVIVTSVYPVEKQRELVADAHAYYDKSRGVDNLLDQIRGVLRGQEPCASCNHP